MNRLARGMHHFGIGVKDYEVMKEFYVKTLENTDVMAEFSDIWNGLPEVFRQELHNFKGIMFNQPAGGIMTELIAMVLPRPKPIRSGTIRLCDLGINKFSIAVSDVEEFYKGYSEKINFASQPKSTTIPGRGKHNFVYGRDPEGNLIEFVSGDAYQADGRFGGVQSVHEQFSGLVDEVSGVEGTQVRSCLLGCSQGGGMIEISEFMKPRGLPMPFVTNYADFGIMEMCLETDDVFAVTEFCRKKKLNILESPKYALDTDDGTAELWFNYIRDIDGNGLEMIAEVPKGTKEFKMKKPVFNKIAQVSVVVRSVPESVKKYWDKFGIGPWGIHHFDSSNVGNMKEGDETVAHSFKVAVAMIDDVMIELIEPVAGDSIYAKHLNDHGEGLHHVLFDVANFDATAESLSQNGYRSIFSGSCKGIGFNYFDTTDDLSFISEIFKPPPGGLPEPDETYP
ncbi:MAG: VOC family protein [Deltaproteobacteria bacterium]|nr:VOC family protein [Deltaproteobacteria bacterium]